MTNARALQVSTVVLRIALSITFLVSIADRFGWLGPPGAKNVSWGEWSRFVQYVAVLNWYLPKSLIPSLAVLETIVELALALALLSGRYQREVAWGSAALLTSFALTMTLALGIIAPLSYSVFTAAAGALLLGAVSGRQSEESGR